MEYKVIVRRTLFVFKRKDKGGLNLSWIRFLQDNEMITKGQSLILTDSSARSLHFVSGSVPVKYLSGEQFCFIAEAAKYFGRLSEDDGAKYPIWLGVDSNLPGSTGVKMS